VRSWIDHSGEVVWDPSLSLVEQLVEAGQAFWLDIENPTGQVVDQLATVLGLHPLAVEDSKQFGQRAKLQVYGNGAMLVGFGLDEQLHELVEVHCYYPLDSWSRCAARPALLLRHCARQVRSNPSLEATRSGRCIR
jgi:magnesium transporter